MGEVADIDEVFELADGLFVALFHQLRFITEYQQIIHTIDMGAGGEVETGTYMPPLLIAITGSLILPVFLLLRTLLLLPEHQITEYFPTQRRHYTASCLQFKLRFYPILIWYNEIGEIPSSFEQLVVFTVQLLEDVFVVESIVVYGVEDVGDLGDVVLVLFGVVEVFL